MPRSLSLALYLALTAGRASGERGRPPAARPEGSVIWLHGSRNAAHGSAARIAERLSKERTKMSFIVTEEGHGPLDLSDYPRGTLTVSAPGERAADLAAFLTHWKPDLAVLTGETLPPRLVVAASEAGVPMILSDFHIGEAGGARAWFGRRLVRALLPRFNAVLVPDRDTEAELRDLAGAGFAVTVTGRMELMADPLPCNEAERMALSAIVGTRPVWAAVACPMRELDAVLAAHGHALRLAHRMLLVIVPADPGEGEAMATRIAQEGYTVALRSHEDEPVEDVQILVADTEGELGLWYRFAPVTFMGGTLTGDARARSPLEPAALGSAIVAGPAAAAHAEAYRRMADARAMRSLRGPGGLPEAIGDLIAPDRAATLAHNAWVAASGGAEAVNAVAALALRLLDRPVTKVPVRPTVPA